MQREEESFVQEMTHENMNAKPGLSLSQFTMCHDEIPSQKSLQVKTTHSWSKMLPAPQSYFIALVSSKCFMAMWYEHFVRLSSSEAEWI